MRGAVSVTELCDLLDASPATIRRDLAALERDGVVSRANEGWCILVLGVEGHDLASKVANRPPIL